MAKVAPSSPSDEGAALCCAAHRCGSSRGWVEGRVGVGVGVGVGVRLGCEGV